MTKPLISRVPTRKRPIKCPHCGAKHKPHMRGQRCPTCGKRITARKGAGT